MSSAPGPAGSARPLLILAAAVLLVGPLLPGASAHGPARDDARDVVGPPDGAPASDVDPKIEAILDPLATVPRLLEDASTLRFELDADEVPPILLDLRAELVPSFGHADEPIPLTVDEVDRSAESRTWPDRDVIAVTAQVPSVADDAHRATGLHDLEVSWLGGGDRQPRAVDLVEAYPEDPKVAILADPSVGDPRPIQEAADEVTARSDPLAVQDEAEATAGTPTDPGRWAALRKAIREVNLVDPDVVLITGDLTFGAHPRVGDYEYEDAYRLVNRLRAPTYAAPGNHDLYTLDPQEEPWAVDGKEPWNRYFGPLNYTVDLTPDIRLLVLNTFEWDQQERIPFLRPDAPGEVASGGTISDEQVAWARQEVEDFRQDRPDGEIVSFAHHDPSWAQEPHPWPGENRLALRDLLNETDVGVHFAGHKHNDRLARYHLGNVVETNGRAGSDAAGELRYVLRDGGVDGSWTRAGLEDVLRNRTQSSLFVTTTTTASGLEGPDWGWGGYWGWRLGVLDDDNQGYHPDDFGYPVTTGFLEGHAERPGNWNADHGRTGLFSYPSFHLNWTVDGANDGSRERVQAHVDSDLATASTVTLPISVAASDPADVTVDRGTVLGTRTADGVTDVWVQVQLDARDEATVTVQGRADALPGTPVVGSLGATG